MRLNIKSWGKWLVLLLVLVVVAVAASRFMSERKAKQLQTSAPKAAPMVELAASDVVKARMLDVTQGLAISGTLKAVNTAVVKARVAGELQGLTLREGDFVKAGQIIARIDASELQSRSSSGPSSGVVMPTRPANRLNESTASSAEPN